MIHFTGSSHFKDLQGEDIFSAKWKDGRILENTAKSFVSKGCTTTYAVLPALCSEGLHYPWDSGCIADIKGYYYTTSSTQCDQETILNDIGGGGFGDVGGLGNGSGPIIAGPLMLPLNELGIYNNLPSNLKNYVLTLHNSGQDYELVLFAIRFWGTNSSTTWEQFQNWFLNGYSSSYINKLPVLSSEELQEFVNINQEIDASPYDEENLKEANEIYVAITAHADLSSMNETDVETVLSQCCPNLIVVPQALISEKTKVIALNYKNLRRLYPNWSKGKCLWEASRDTVQLLLDIGGTFPLIGEVCDLTNGSIYAMNGDALNAALSYSAAIPLAGWGATVSKYAVKVVHLANGAKTSLKFIRRLDGFVTFGNRGQLRKVLGMIKGDARQAHHIIPWELYDSPAIQKAALSSNAFHLNEALNGIPLNNAVHYGSHGNYNSLVKQRLDAIPSNYTPNQVYNEVMDIIQDIRTAINNHPNTPINQLVF
ncbi:AHH domain-containing protein [uncultured Chryseobacterium sp.]|uniref:AHH domain-containing protein n=1 Tax=uncultured Chryseobacterium sp. TaxID=259322 RepID=UPI0025F102AF|nr:AHH domain-containing protein [uncultured Chryseobacterium sp.]